MSADGRPVLCDRLCCPLPIAADMASRSEHKEHKGRHHSHGHSHAKSSGANSAADAAAVAAETESPVDVDAELSKRQSAIDHASGSAKVQAQKELLTFIEEHVCRRHCSPFESSPVGDAESCLPCRSASVSVSVSACSVCGLRRLCARSAVLCCISRAHWAMSIGQYWSGHSSPRAMPITTNSAK
jgi:hypothetical protein